MGMKAITFKNFSEEFHRILKVQAAKEMITLKELIEKAVTEYIAKYERVQKKGGK